MSGQRESNPLSKFRDVARFQPKVAATSALSALSETKWFARIAQNNAVPLSEIVRNQFAGFERLFANKSRPTL
jgi:hypothetical protein